MACKLRTCRSTSAICAEKAGQRLPDDTFRYTHSAPRIHLTQPTVPAAIRRLMDYVAVGLCVFGETAAALLLPSSWTIYWFSPLFLCGVALIVVRHVIWRRPSLPELAWRRARQVLDREGARFSWTVAGATRLGVLAVGVVAVTLLPWERPRAASSVSDNRVYDLPSRWDAAWYASVARHGYVWRADRRDEQQSVAFFPAYPAAMRVSADLVTAVAKALRDPYFLGGGTARFVWGGVIVSVLCFGLALSRLYTLAAHETGEPATARRTLLLLASYPFALFFSAPYSESLALLAIVSTVLAWREGSAPRAAAWGVVAGLTRSNGWTLSAALVADWLLGRRREPGSTWLAAALAPAGAAALFSGYMYTLTGHPFEWVAAQRVWVGEVRPFEFVTRRYDLIAVRGLAHYLATEPVDAMAAASIVLMAIAAVFFLLRRNWLYAALIAAYLAPALVVDLAATGRLTSVLFPGFVALALWTRGPTAALVGVAFAAGQVWLATRFFHWQTPF